MISIYFNDKVQYLATQISLQELLIQNSLDIKHFAVALNLEFIPRSRYSETWLNAGDKIDIITPMQGG